MGEPRKMLQSLLDDRGSSVEDGPLSDGEFQSATFSGSSAHSIFIMWTGFLAPYWR